MNIRTHLKKESKKINRALERCLPKPEGRVRRLHEAMRYAVLPGGKRIRPVLALAACRAVGGDPEKVLPAACALELIHNYSLVHDDLPCMDNDRTRRGRPTCHVRFGEATAVLAGDALLTLAFNVLSGENGSGGSRDWERRLEASRMIAEAVGAHGMVAGQAVDMAFKSKSADVATMDYINAHKSGDLIAISVKVGGFLGGGTPKEVEALYRYGKTVGLLFQIVDDILDREGYAKTAGISQARQKAKALFRKALLQLLPFGRKGRILNELTKTILGRIASWDPCLKK